MPKRRRHSAMSRPLEQQTQPEAALGNKDKVLSPVVSVAKAEKFQGHLNEQLKNVIKDPRSFHVLSLPSSACRHVFSGIQMAAVVASIVYSHKDRGRPKTTPTLHVFYFSPINRLTFPTGLSVLVDEGRGKG